MNATTSTAAASHTRPRPAKPSRTRPIPGTTASGQTSLDCAGFGSRAPRAAKASTATTQPISGRPHRSCSILGIARKLPRRKGSGGSGPTTESMTRRSTWSGCAAA